MVDVFWWSKCVVGIFSLIFFEMFYRILVPHNALNYNFPCLRSGKCTPLYMNIVSESDSKLVYSKLSIAMLYLGWYSHVPFLWNGNFTGDCQPVFAAFLVCWGTVQEMKHLEDYENVNLWYNYDTMKKWNKFTTHYYFVPWSWCPWATEFHAESNANHLEQNLHDNLWKLSTSAMINNTNVIMTTLDGYHWQIIMRNNISIIYGTDDLAP